MADQLTAPLTAPYYTDRRVQVAAALAALAIGYHIYRRRSQEAEKAALLAAQPIAPAAQPHAAVATPVQQHPQMIGQAGHGMAPPLHPASPQSQMEMGGGGAQDYYADQQYGQSQ